MKTKFVLIFLFSFFVTSIIAQNSFPYIFNNRDDISNGNEDSGIQLLNWNNGILYLGYCFDSTITNQGFTLTFYDTLGTLQWHKSYFSPTYKILQGNDIIALNNSSFYVGGVIYNQSNTQWDSFIAKFDNNGDSIFFNYYIDTLYNWIFDLEKFDNNEILMLGAEKDSSTSEYARTIVGKIDSTGNIVSLFRGVFEVKYPRQIIKGSNKIYVGGTLKTSPGDNFNTKVFIKDFTTDLQFIGNHIMYGTTNEDFAGLTIINNRLYLTSQVTILVPPNPNSFAQCNIKKLNTNFTYSISNNFGPYDFFDNLDVNTAKNALNNNILAFSVYKSQGGLTGFYFVDTTLTLICAQDSFITYITNNNIREFIILPSNKIAGVGAYWPSSVGTTQDHWNFLTDNIVEYINSTCNLSIIENQEINDKQEFISYPTLVDDYFIVKCSSDYLDFSVVLYNSLGQRIIRLNGHGEIKVNSSMLKSGFYYILIENKSKNIVFKLFKNK